MKLYQNSVDTMEYTSLEVAQAIDISHSELVSEIKYIIKTLQSVGADEVHFFKMSDYIKRDGSIVAFYDITIKGLKILTKKYATIAKSIIEKLY